MLALITDALIALGSGATAHAAWAGAGAVAGAGVLAFLERRSAAPVFAPQVTRARGVAAGLLAGGAVNFALTGGLFVLPLLLQQQRNLSPVQIGLAFLPLTLPCAFNPLLTGRIVARVGARPPVLGGLFLLAAGGVVLGLAALSGAAYGMLALGLAMTGFGVSFALPALVTAVVSAAPAGTAGTAGGLFNAGRQVGATLGVAAMGAFVAAEGGVPGGGHALLLSAAVCLLAALPQSTSLPRVRRPLTVR